MPLPAPESSSSIPHSIYQPKIRPSSSPQSKFTATSPGILSPGPVAALPDDHRGVQHQSSLFTQHSEKDSLNKLTGVPIPWKSQTYSEYKSNLSYRSLKTHDSAPLEYELKTPVTSPGSFSDLPSPHLESKLSADDVAVDHFSSRACSPAVTSLTIDTPPSLRSALSSFSRIPTASSKRRHSQFYLTDTLVVVEVDGCLFRIHRSFLERESAHFREIFSRDSSLGIHDENAIRLSNIRINEFERLLQFLYTGVHFQDRYAWENWLDLLAAADALECLNIRQRAIRELYIISIAVPMHPVDRILVARKHNITSWLSPAYVDLCVRDTSLLKWEIDLLGSELTSRLCDIRERLLLEVMESLVEREQSGGGKQESKPFPHRSTCRAKKFVKDIIVVESKEVCK
ncbi:hypothetical protein BC835DRAFT_588538 [Cytidiella melzeri]|nr:hypothetical protein BC835DRAFT_588538 [Cytidiella melzeri]